MTAESPTHEQRKARCKDVHLESQVLPNTELSQAHALFPEQTDG